MSLNNVIRMLDEEIATWYPHPGKRMQMWKFEMASYRRWAIEECRRYLLQNSDWPPVIAMENFRALMDEAACEATTASQNYTFSIAYDIATEVLDMIRRMD